MITSSTDASQNAAPVAPRRPTTRSHHGHDFIDDYEWLRDKDSPEVLGLMQQELDYAQAATEQLNPLRAELFEEIKNRNVETVVSAPTRKGDWWYTVRNTEDTQYPRYYRLPASNTGDARADYTAPVLLDAAPDPAEELILDCNELAAGQEFFSLGGLTVSEDGTLMAYATDTTGDERFTIYFKDLNTGQLRAEQIDGAFYSLAFDPTGKRLFYTVVDATWRPHQIKVHTLGTDPATDTVLFQEDEASMWLDFGLTEQRDELLISVGNSEYSESWGYLLTDPEASLTKYIDRDQQLLHSVDAVVESDGERHYVLTHDRYGPNNAISLVARDEFAKPLHQQRWRHIIDHRDDVKLDGAARNKSFLVVEARKDTAPRVLVLPLTELEKAGTDQDLFGQLIEPHFDEELYSLGAAYLSIDSDLIRLGLTSFTTADQLWDWWVAQDSLTLVKERAVRDYNAADYVVERLWAPAADGTKIPLSVMRHKDVKQDGTAPMFIYGYGSYEISIDPSFSIPRLSLLDRGVVYVVAHIRGGGELGRSWYTEGKKLHKMRSFTDFVDATRYMGSTGWIDPEKVAAAGRSAGGLLMGAITNLAPELYKLIIAGVPFVDPLTSILDPELPLSALEWEEWGNPITDPEVYEYMRSYSPYENITDRHYPTVLAVTNLHDTRVLYVEPAKWVQLLRRHQQAAAPILLKIDMEGGHGGGSGRHKSWQDWAWEHAVALDIFGISAK
ncbi:S9 family peptidase [Micrococcoides hystricis]|uniref:S9 family peptidase n=1 Tax=Micrococcoides hystricis TaxID=1572761 RepID=A0ABV6P996_9MICC